MSESEFLQQVDLTMHRIEAALERATDLGETDVECSRSGNVLEIEFIENGSKIIINSQSSMQEIWVAAKAGGYHYKFLEGSWRNTRDASELMATLSALVTAQGGSVVTLT